MSKELYAPFQFRGSGFISSRPKIQSHVLYVFFPFIDQLKKSLILITAYTLKYVKAPAPDISFCLFYFCFRLY